MSGVLLNDFSNSDSNILKVQSTLDKTFFGKIDTITLTEFDSSTVPAIAAGSVVENNGSLYQFATEEAISTTDPGTSSTVADGTVYVLLVPGTGTITAAFTATAPTWSDSKQGWYGTGDEANYRYIGGATKATASYSDKFIIKNTPLITDMKGINLTGNADISGDVSIGGDVSIVGDIDLTSNFQQFEQIKYYTGTLNASGTASFDSGLSDLENYIVLHAMFLFVDATYGKWINQGTLSTNLYLSTSTSSPNYILLTFDDAYAENADYRIVIAKIL